MHRILSLATVLSKLSMCALLVACETPRPTNDVVVMDASDSSVAIDQPSVDVLTQDITMMMQESGPSADVEVRDSSVDAPTDVPTAPVCVARATDFQPRSIAPRLPPWNMCPLGVANPNVWTHFGPSRTNAIRVTSVDVFDVPGALFDPTRDPAPMEFTAADTVFQSSGLGVRFQRRADEHFAPAMPLVLNATYQDYCANVINHAANPDYCAGPVSINPAYIAAVSAGMSGMGGPSRVHAARMQAAYYWWLYLSVYKEPLTCVFAIDDCDSGYGVFTGAADRNSMVQYGLAKALLALGDPGREAFDRIWDALLAVRCWREQDGGGAIPAVEATNAMLREQARDQLDRAMTRGMALIVQARLRTFASTEGVAARASERLAHGAWLGVIGPLVARAIETWVSVRYPMSQANVRMRVVTALRLGAAITSADAGRAAADLEAIFECP